MVTLAQIYEAIKVAHPVCHVTKRCNATIMNDEASPFEMEINLPQISVNC